MNTTIPVLTAADFASDYQLPWCPGCGLYSCMAQTKRILPSTGIPPENIVVVAGNDCHLHMAYGLNTYGLQCDIGMEFEIAWGVKMARPDLHVIVVTGDEAVCDKATDNLMHLCRRNVDVAVLYFNDRIKARTKGQATNASPLGKISKSTPMGKIEQPFNICALAATWETTFIGRSIDVYLNHFKTMLKRAIEHKGTAFLEVYQNCNVFNDGAFKFATDRNCKGNNIVEVKHGKPIIFGNEQEKGIRLNGLEPEMVPLGKGIGEDDLLFMDEKAAEPSLAFLLGRMLYPEFPEPIGVFRAVHGPIYEQELQQQSRAAEERKGLGNLQELFLSGDTFVVE